MSEEQLDKLRHSTSHIMAEAVLHLFPGAKFAIGPSIEDGFYYDFDLPRPLTPEDLATIEARMREIIKTRSPFERREISRQEAEEMFADQPYNLELIAEMPEEEFQSALRFYVFTPVGDVFCSNRCRRSGKTCRTKRSYAK